MQTQCGRQVSPGGNAVYLAFSSMKYRRRWSDPDPFQHAAGSRHLIVENGEQSLCGPSEH